MERCCRFQFPDDMDVDHIRSVVVVDIWITRLDFRSITGGSHYRRHGYNSKLEIFVSDAE